MAVVPVKMTEVCINIQMYLISVSSNEDKKYELMNILFVK